MSNISWFGNICLLHYAWKLQLSVSGMKLVGQFTFRLLRPNQSGNYSDFNGILDNICRKSPDHEDEICNY